MGVIKQENTMTNLSKIEQEILSQAIPTSKAVIDLGSEINAEMYYNYNSSSCSYSYSDSTFQQSTEPSAPTNENVDAPTAQFPSSPSALPLREEKKTVGSGPRKNIPRKISSQDVYTYIRVSVNEIRRGPRTSRMNAYLSLQEENDKKISIYMRSSLTTATDETFRSLKKTDNRPLIDALQQIMDNCPNTATFFSGRLRYNPRKFKIEDEHKTNIKSAILGIYDYGKTATAILFMFNEYYVIELNDDLTQHQAGIFAYTGCFSKEVDEEK